MGLGLCEEKSAYEGKAIIAVQTDTERFVRSALVHGKRFWPAEQVGIGKVYRNSVRHDEHCRSQVDIQTPQ